MVMTVRQQLLNLFIVSCFSLHIRLLLTTSSSVIPIAEGFALQQFMHTVCNNRRQQQQQKQTPTGWLKQEIIIGNNQSNDRLSHTRVILGKSSKLLLAGIETQPTKTPQNDDDDDDDQEKEEEKNKNNKKNNESSNNNSNDETSSRNNIAGNDNVVVEEKPKKMSRLAMAAADWLEEEEDDELANYWGRFEDAKQQKDDKNIKIKPSIDDSIEDDNNNNNISTEERLDKYYESRGIDKRMESKYKDKILNAIQMAQQKASSNNPKDAIQQLELVRQYMQINTKFGGNALLELGQAYEANDQDDIALDIYQSLKSNKHRDIQRQVKQYIKNLISISSEERKQTNKYYKSNKNNNYNNVWNNIIINNPFDSWW